MVLKKFTWRFATLLLLTLIVGIHAMGAETAGRNDTVLVNTDITDNLTTKDEYDTYKFHLNNSGSLTIKFDYSTEGNYVVELNQIQSNGIVKEIATRNFSSSATSATGRITEYTDKCRVPAGDYFVKITHRSYLNYSAANYSLSLVYGAESVSNHETEFNDTLQTSNVINVNSDYIGNLSNNNEADYYKFTLNTKGSIQLSFNYNTEGAYTLLLYHLESNGTLTTIQSSDFYTSSSSISGKITETKDKIRVPSGTYYIKLNRKSYYDFYNGDYTLKVLNVSEGANVESEYNDALNQANPIAISSSYMGNLNNSDDVDYYSFSVSTYHLYKTKFSYSPIGQYSITLYKVDASGKINALLVSDFYNANNTKTTSNLTEYGNNTGLYAGNYLIAIKRKSYSTYSNADYQFSLQLVNSTTKPGKVTSLSAKNTKTKTIKISYKKVSSANGYQVAYSTSKNFKKQVKYKLTTSTSLQLKKLTKKKTYYIKARAYKLNSTKTKLYGPWSTVKKVTIKK